MIQLLEDANILTLLRIAQNRIQYLFQQDVLAMFYQIMLGDVEKYILKWQYILQWNISCSYMKWNMVFCRRILF